MPARCLSHPTVVAPGWNLSLVEGELRLQTAGGSPSTCQKMTILVNGIDPIAVAVSDNLSRLSNRKEETGRPTSSRRPPLPQRLAGAAGAFFLTSLRREVEDRSCAAWCARISPRGGTG